MPLVMKDANGAMLESLPIQAQKIARIATTDGLTTGLIPSFNGNLLIVTVTSATDINAIVTLPVPVVGQIIVLIVDATGCELRTNSPTTVGINGGTGSAAESAIPVSTTAVLVCETATNWKGFMMHTTAGTLAKAEVAAP